MSITHLIPPDFAGDPDALAEQILCELIAVNDTEKMVQCLVSTVAAEVRRLLRDRARIVEKEIDTALARPPRVVGKNWRPAIDRKSAFLHSLFSTGDGQPDVTWGDATVEQHKRRIALLDRNIDGINLTKARHEKAVAAITQAGVTCLKELPELPEELS